MRALSVGVALLAAALSSACDDSPSGDVTPTPRPIPSPVDFAQEPQGGAFFGDASFDALPGATADFGQLGGTLYRVEMPDTWNGRLVMFMHGSHDNTDELFVENPAIRSYLIRNGYAWAGSSFSSNIHPISWTVDETAALWDAFVAKHGMPSYSYVAGESDGGSGAVLSAITQAERYQGALAMCSNTAFRDDIDYRAGGVFVAGAYVAGITQEEFDDSDPAALIDERVLPALEDQANRARFQDILIALSGGERPFDRSGIDFGWDQIWEYTHGQVELGLIGNADREYALGQSAGVASDEFNRGVVRHTDFNQGLHDALTAGDHWTGALTMPLLSVHTTGDVVNPLYWERLLLDRVTHAGRGDLLVQRTIAARGHCGHTQAEFEESLEALVAWVEQGNKPDGEDLSASLANTGEYTVLPRLGSGEGDAIPGAGERFTISGTLTLDGVPITDGGMWVTNIDDGLVVQPCHYLFGDVDSGSYAIIVVTEAEIPRCTGAADTLYFRYFRAGEYYTAEQAYIATGEETAVSLDLTFVSANPAGATGPGDPNVLYGTAVTGNVFGADGRRMPAGTLVEAYIGDVLCGVWTMPPLVGVFSEPGVYFIDVARPQRVDGCTVGEQITFRVDGDDIEGGVVHDIAEEPHDLELVVP